MQTITLPKIKTNFKKLLELHSQIGTTDKQKTNDSKV